MYSEVTRVFQVAASGTLTTMIPIPRFSKGRIYGYADQLVGGDCTVKYIKNVRSGGGLTTIAFAGNLGTLIPDVNQQGTIEIDNLCDPFVQIFIEANAATLTNFTLIFSGWTDE